MARRRRRRRGRRPRVSKVLSADAGWVEDKLSQELRQIRLRIMKQQSLIALLMAGAAAGAVGACLTLVMFVGSGNIMLIAGTVACVGLAASCAYGATRARRLLRRLQGGYRRREKARRGITNPLNWTS